MLINMTTPDERTRALLLAGELLTQLANSAKTPDVPDRVRKQAQHVLRHYPSKGDIRYLAEDAERGAFIAGPMLDATVASINDGVQNSESDENRRMSPLERVANHGGPILFIIAVGFLLAAVGVIVSLMCKFGSIYCA